MLDSIPSFLDVSLHFLYTLRITMIYSCVTYSIVKLIKVLLKAVIRLSFVYMLGKYDDKVYLFVQSSDIANILEKKSAPNSPFSCKPASIPILTLSEMAPDASMLCTALPLQVGGEKVNKRRYVSGARLDRCEE